MILHKQEKDLLKQLEKKVSAKIEELEMNRDSARRAAFWLAEKNLASVKEGEKRTYQRTVECEKYAKEGFPEIRIMEKVGRPVSELGEEEKIGLIWAKKNNWIDIKEGKIEKLEEPPAEYALQKAALEPEKAAPEEIELLKKRKLLREETEKELLVSITQKGKEEAAKLEEGAEEEDSWEIGELTDDVIASGKWKSSKFRKYSIAPTRDAAIGKVHPMTRMVSRIKRAFRDMGFEEIEGGMVESAFWNFDALFQPQDHPARELADTFYLAGEEKIEDRKLLERVKESHEKGWKYEWSEKEARRRVLRTHTTALSARHLHMLKGREAKKYFAVGRVFRNEATDFKHLAEFHQVEGIVAWEGATFRDLLGLLKQFYSNFGFEKIRFRPSYFPYTEPSVEIEVFFEEKGEWMELGGAGVFRPEMTKPLCDVYPVLAFGLSLERPMMLMEGLKDIRAFYKNDLEWLKGGGVNR
ncbi:phenylalanine--tRNA ligase subunit alpha [Candidatus Micrarchaeota archaeon]|nr:phenylalanine--tRNA ligase subunit alpha [Candidatus Micrarchaeota archaeon]